MLKMLSPRLNRIKSRLFLKEQNGQFDLKLPLFKQQKR
ncbi:MAG: hypothetical protein ACJAQ4_000652 [Cryomorphaceae bacterium]